MNEMARCQALVGFFVCQTLQQYKSAGEKPCQEDGLDFKPKQFQQADSKHGPLAGMPCASKQMNTFDQPSDRPQQGRHRRRGDVSFLQRFRIAEVATKSCLPLVSLDRGPIRLLIAHIRADPASRPCIRFDV